MNPKPLIYILLFTTLSLNLSAQGTLGKIETYELEANANGQHYQLLVSLPKSYVASDTIKYPVLYVLDGNFMFPIMNAYQYLLSEVGEVQEVIVVGIGYSTNSILGSTVFRTPDYTPTKDTAFENMLLRDMQIKVRTGDANKFLQAMKQDIFPFIEKKYKTKDRGLAGHSFGALLGAYAMVKEPELFSKYLLSSISMFWDKEVLLKKEQALLQSGKNTINAKAFITVGALEGYMEMIPGMKRFTSALREHNYQGLTIEERILPNESHASAFLTAFNQGLRFLYKKQ